MGNGVEYISCSIIVYFSVTLRDARRAGALLTLFFFKREATGAELTFYHSIIGNFMVDMI